MTASSAYQAIREAFEADDFDLALKLANARLKTHENDGRCWELKGLVHHARQEFESALNALETAMMFVSLNLAASVCLGQCYGRIGKRDLSRDVLASLISDARLSCELLLQIAAGLDAVDQPRLAMDACRRATERDPMVAQVYYDMGFYAARCGHSPRIVESLARKALSLEPQNIGYRLGLSSFLIKAGKSKEALEIIRTLTTEEIERIRCRCCLERVVDLLESVGDYRRAIVCRQQLLNLELQQVEPDCE